MLIDTASLLAKLSLRYSAERKAQEKNNIEDPKSADVASQLAIRAKRIVNLADKIKEAQ